MDEWDKEDTDPDIFRVKHPVRTETGYAGQDSDTVPRCIHCGQAVNDATAFDRGMTYAIQGVYWMLKKRMPEPEAARLAQWFRQGIIG